METKNPFDRHPPTEEPSIEQELLSFIQLVATPKRPDGTYNYCREALEVKAKDLLANIARKGLPLMGVNSRIFS